MRLAVKAVLDKMRKKKDRKLKRLSILAKISKRVTSNYMGKRDCNRKVMLHFYAKRKTRICTTRPRFPFTCHLLFIISAHKFVILHNFFFLRGGAIHYLTKNDGKRAAKSVLFAWFASHHHNLQFNSVPSSRASLSAS